MSLFLSSEHVTSFQPGSLPKPCIELNQSKLSQVRFYLYRDNSQQQLSQPTVRTESISVAALCHRPQPPSHERSSGRVYDPSADSGRRCVSSHTSPEGTRRKHEWGWSQIWQSNCFYFASKKCLVPLLDTFQRLKEVSRKKTSLGGTQAAWRHGLRPVMWLEAEDQCRLHLSFLWCIKWPLMDLSFQVFNVLSMWPAPTYDGSTCPLWFYISAPLHFLWTLRPSKWNDEHMLDLFVPPCTKLECKIIWGRSHLSFFFWFFFVFYIHFVSFHI